MNNQDDLLELIQALTRSEKRYLSTRAKRRGDEDSNYLRLFNAFNEMKEYDEEKLKKKFKGEKLLKNLSKEKKYLFDVILKTMRAYRHEKSVNAQIKERLMDATFLLEKGLYSQSLKCLSNAKKLAYTYEHYLAILEIILKERSVFTARRKKADYAQLGELWKEKEKVMAILGNQYTFEQIFDEVLILALKDYKLVNEKSREYLEALMKNPVLVDKELPHSFVSQYRYHQIYALYNQYLGDYKAAQSYYKKVLDCWQEHTHFCSEYINHYTAHLSNFISSCYLLEDFEPVHAIIETLKGIPAKNHQAEGILFQHIMHNEQFLYMNLGQMDSAIEMVPVIDAGLKKYQDVLEGTRVHSFMSNIATVYFLAENFKESMVWSNRLIKLGHLESRLDLQRAVRILKLVALFELGEVDEFENFYRAINRYFNKLATKRELDILTLKYLKQLYKATPSEQSNVLDAFQIELERLESNPATQGDVGLDEMQLWVKSKIRKRPIVELIKEERKK